MIPVRYLILEGPDCSGKTTLYQNIHKVTRFKHNIQDRSALSMLCYAVLYGRDERIYRENLLEELCDANIYHVILLPDLEVILRRFRNRGDEFQNEESLVRLHGIFLAEASKIRHLPNVHVIDQCHDPISLTAAVVKDLDAYASLTPGEFGALTSRWCDLSPRKEVQVKVSFDVPLTHSDKEIYRDPTEGEYFGDISDDARYIIDKEIEGDNPYDIPQDRDSRRFYFHSDTCISSIHFLPRDGHLKVLCTLRSTNSVHNGPLDLRFLAQLSSEVANFYEDWCVDRITLDVRFNSLHVRK